MSGSGDSDHEALESSATGLSGSGSNGGLDEESANDDDDDTDSASQHAAWANGPAAAESDDFTTKRLKTFVATTLHNERVYLEKLSRLLSFKSYLEECFGGGGGSQADISVLFSGVQQIYTTHDIVASKLQSYLNSLTDLLMVSGASGSNCSTSSPLLGSNSSRAQISTKLAAQLDIPRSG